MAQHHPNQPNYFNDWTLTDAQRAEMLRADPITDPERRELLTIMGDLLADQYVRAAKPTNVIYIGMTDINIPTRRLWTQIANAAELQMIVDRMQVDDLDPEWYGQVHELRLGRMPNVTELLEAATCLLDMIVDTTLTAYCEVFANHLIEGWVLLDAVKGAYLAEYLRDPRALQLATLFRAWAVLDAYKSWLLRVHVALAGYAEDEPQIARANAILACLRKA